MLLVLWRQRNNSAEKAHTLLGLLVGSCNGNYTHKESTFGHSTNSTTHSSHITLPKYSAAYSPPPGVYTQLNRKAHLYDKLLVY